jgi:seryl-tRNA synthetase
LLVPLGARGIYGFNGVFEDIVGRFSGLLDEYARLDGAERRNFPPTLSRAILEKQAYLDSFPHLCGSVFSFSGTELEAAAMARRAASGEPWSAFQAMTDVVLTPAVCYPLYRTLRGTLPREGRTFSLEGWVYRQEPSDEPTRMRAFRMREFVRAGTPDQVLEWRDRWLRRALELLTSLGLDARDETAADPFFGRRGRMLTAHQKEQRLKCELLIPLGASDGPTAVCSINLHGDHFASKWEIRGTDAGLAHTGCLGFGLERVAIALFQAHGVEPREWPVEVVARLARGGH